MGSDRGTLARVFGEGRLIRSISNTLSKLQQLKGGMGLSEILPLAGRGVFLLSPTTYVTRYDSHPHEAGGIQAPG